MSTHPDPTPSVSLRGLTKVFGGSKVVDGLDLDVASGEFFSLLGPSGCGKTTTLRMIAGFSDPTSGTILVGAGLLVFALVFDDFVLAFFTTGVDPQPLPVRVYSSIRFGVSPAINAIGTLMLVASAVLIVAALTIPRLFNRGTSSLDLITGGERR